MHNILKWSLIGLTPWLIVACGGSSNDSNDPNPQPSNKTATDKLLPVTQSSDFENYLKTGLAHGSTYGYAELAIDDTAEAMPGNTAASATSTTNLQVEGVDELDIIKNDQHTLYRINNHNLDPYWQVDEPTSDTNTTSTKPSIEIYQLNSDPATHQLITEISLTEDTQQLSGLYLTQQSQLLAIGNQSNYQAELLYSPWGYWQPGNTTLTAYQVSDPTQPQQQWHLQLDGHLISSRIVGNVLYLVSNYTPYPDQLIRYPQNDADIEYNQALLANIDIQTLMPKITIDGTTLPLVEPTQCFLPDGQQAIEGEHYYGNNAITTLTAIDLSNVSAFQSSCYAGNADNLYATSNAIYLTESQHRDYAQWWYENDSNTITAGNTTASLLATLDINTSIHKFALHNTDIQYRGSATVPGQLYSNDYHAAAFRMHENGDYLNVVSSWGWSEPEHRLTVFQEGADFTLQEVNHLPNDAQPAAIGKPHEHIYAVRYFNDRAYIVTFNKVDPLYVLNLADNTSPYVAGELELPGYSAYLHPVNDRLLLGIGKDATTENGTTWYQGLKIALFDVADIAQPKVLTEIGLGQRGTEATILNDHHGVSYLKGDTVDKFAIPVSLNDGRGDNVPANTYAPWVHDALYQFEINHSTDSLQQVGELIRQTDTTEGVYSNIYDNRAVIQQDAVHFIYNTGIVSGKWGE